MPSYLSADYQGILATLDGETATISVWGSGVVASQTPATLADLETAGDESTGGTYARVDVELEWEPVSKRLIIAAADLPATVDLLGDPDVKNIVFSLPGASDAAREVLAMFALPVAVTGYDGFSINPPNGIAGIFSDSAPSTPEIWGVGSDGTAYLDRGRVWLDGTITINGTLIAGTLPAGHWPAATTVLPVTVLNDSTGTPAYIAARLEVATDGTVTLQDTASITGDVVIPVTGLSFLVAS